MYDAVDFLSCMKNCGLVLSTGLLLFAFVTMAAAAPATDVAIAPFSAVGDSAGGDWIGKAVQQNLIADLAPGAFSAEAEIVAGLAEGYVIRGSYQQSEQLIRFSGQLVEARKQPSGPEELECTPGSLKDLFALEDTLSEPGNWAASTIDGIGCSGGCSPGAYGCGFGSTSGGV